MTQIPLMDGSYKARSIIASAQRCVNLFPEINQLTPPAPFPQPMTNSLITHYPTPGLTRLATVGSGPIRGLYSANNGKLYCVSGTGVYYISPTWTATLLGNITAGSTPVSMADNSLKLVLVDGTLNGYTIDLATNTFAQINDPAFYGATRVDFIDTFMFMNKPGTPQFYSTDSGIVTPLDPLYFANKTGYADNLVVAVAMHREIWLIGEYTTEVWYNAGNANFPFAEIPGSFVQQGCAAKYSVAVQDKNIFWLSKNQQGQGIVVAATGYDAVRISTHAIENAFREYGTISDAVGFIYQQEGHVFYVLNFPSADKTWVYDTGTQLWHERAWTGTDNKEHRIRANCHAPYQGKNVVGDWQNGNLYAFDLDNYTDDGQPIVRVRSFPTLQNELKRVVYTKFIADMEVAGATATVSSNDLLVGLRYSDTGGQSWSDYTYQTIGAVGEFNTNMQWRRLGMGRRRVFELSWSAPVMTALNGAYIDIQQAAS